MSRDELRSVPVAGSRRRTSRYTNDPVSLGLRKLWQNVEQEAVPAEFLDLLDAIDAASAGDPANTDAVPTGDCTGKPA